MNALGEKKKHFTKMYSLGEKKYFRRKVGQNAPTLDVIYERKGGHQKILQVGQ